MYFDKSVRLQSSDFRGTAILSEGGNFNSFMWIGVCIPLTLTLYSKYSHKP